MLGNGARFLGPSAAGNATSSTNNQQHQSQFNRSLWPTATTFQANGECEYFRHHNWFFVFYIIF